jgi:hypothetical protein
MAKRKKHKQKIIIFFKDGKKDKIPQKLWDDYEYMDHCFVVIRKEQWIAIYNMDDISCVTVG